MFNLRIYSSALLMLLSIVSTASAVAADRKDKFSFQLECSGSQSETGKKSKAASGVFTFYECKSLTCLSDYVVIERSSLWNIRDVVHGMTTTDYLYGMSIGDSEGRWDIEIERQSGVLSGTYTFKGVLPPNTMRDIKMVCKKHDTPQAPPARF